MLEKHKEIVKLAVKSVSEAIIYSKSGVFYGIQRPELGGYISNDSKIEAINSEMQAGHFEEALNLMIKEKVGDCFEQSLLLALILKRIANINTQFRIYIASSIPDYERKGHTFVMLLSKDNALYFDDRLNNAHVLINGSMLLDSGIVILDSWQNRIYHPMSQAEHVLAVLSSAPDTIPIYLQNLDKVFLALQSYSHQQIDSLAVTFIRRTIASCNRLISLSTELPLRSVSPVFFPSAIEDNSAVAAESTISNRMETGDCL